MQIFYNEEENPCPIETDALLQLENIHKTMKKSLFPAYILLLLCCVFQIFLISESLRRDPIELLSNSSSLFSGMCLILCAVLCVKSLGEYTIWHRRAVRRARETGTFLPIHSHRCFDRGIFFLVLGGGFLWLLSMLRDGLELFAAFGIGYAGILIFLVNAVINILKRKKVSSGLNRTLTIIFCLVIAFLMQAVFVRIVLSMDIDWQFTGRFANTYEYNGETFLAFHEYLPLTIEDLTREEYEDYIYQHTERSSFLCSQLEAGQHPQGYRRDGVELYYRITFVRLPFLYDFCQKEIIKSYELHEPILEPGEKKEESVEFWRHLEAVDPKIWKADKAYRLYLGEEGLQQYLVYYADHLVEIRFGWEPKEEQLEIAGAILEQLGK